MYFIRKSSTLIVFSFISVVCAADAKPDFSVEKDASGATIKIDGELFTKYVLGEANKPYLWPVIGPAGKSMTRAYPMKDVAGEKQDHPHHRSLWFGYQGMGGFDTWHEPLSHEALKESKPDAYRERVAKLGSTVHREFLEVSAGDGKAVIATANDYLDSGGNKIMEDERRFTFSTGGGMRVIDVDITLIATKKVTLDEAKDAGFSLRVAHSMSVDAGEGGRIVNSEGDIDKDAWSKAARWCDFNGPVDGEKMGIAILNHPSSFRHPTTWHARTYGLFTANPFMMEGGEVVMEPGDRITLRHRVLLHKGDEKSARVEEAFRKYAGEK